MVFDSKHKIKCLFFMHMFNLILALYYKGYVFVSSQYQFISTNSIILWIWTANGSTALKIHFLQTMVEVQLNSIQFIYFSILYVCI